MKVSADDVQWVRGAVATHPARDAANVFDMMVMELYALRAVADAASKALDCTHGRQEASICEDCAIGLSHAFEDMAKAGR